MTPVNAAMYSMTVVSGLVGGAYPSVNIDDPASLKAAGPANGRRTSAYAVHSSTIQTLSRTRSVIGPCQARIASRRTLSWTGLVITMNTASTTASAQREMAESMPRGTTRVPTTLVSVRMSSASPNTNPTHCSTSVTPPSWPSRGVFGQASAAGSVRGASRVGAARTVVRTGQRRKEM